MTSLSATERAALADLLDEVGPAHPTLCGDWTTHDLAAHLVARDRRPHSLPGLVLGGPLAGLTERTRCRLRDARRYDELVRLVREGAPAWSPIGFPPTEESANTVEFFVHHEDVRRARAGWEPRDLGSDVQRRLWRRLKSAAPLLLRRFTGGVVVRTPDGAERTVRSGDPTVVLTGEPSELLLFAFGRQEHARVELGGDAEAARSLRQMSLGV